MSDSALCPSREVVFSLVLQKLQVQRNAVSYHHFAYCLTWPLAIDTSFCKRRNSSLHVFAHEAPSQSRAEESRKEADVLHEMRLLRDIEQLVSDKVLAMFDSSKSMPVHKC